MEKILVCSKCGDSDQFFTTTTEYYDCVVDNKGNPVAGTKTFADSCNDGRSYVCESCGEGSGCWQDPVPGMLQEALKLARQKEAAILQAKDEKAAVRDRLCAKIRDMLIFWGFQADIEDLSDQYSYNRRVLTTIDMPPPSEKFYKVTINVCDDGGISMYTMPVVMQLIGNHNVPVNGITNFEAGFKLILDAAATYSIRGE